MRLRINRFILSFSFKIVDDNCDNRRLYKFNAGFIINFNYVIEMIL